MKHNSFYYQTRSGRLICLKADLDFESKLYEQYSRLSLDFSHITISTIHKVKGLTSDVTNLFLPLNNPSFDLNDNLFDVATIRAKQGTLIVTYQHIDLLSGTTSETLEIIHSCKDVSDSFIELFLV